MNRDKGSEIPMFPPPPKLPPRRPIEHRSTRDRPSRVNSIDLLDHVPPAPTFESLHNLLHGPVKMDSTSLGSKAPTPPVPTTLPPSLMRGTQEQQQTAPIFRLSNSLQRCLQSVAEDSSSQTPSTPSILVSNDGYTLNSSSAADAVINHHLNTYDRLSSACTGRGGISTSVSAPNGFSQLLAGSSKGDKTSDLHPSLINEKLSLATSLSQSSLNPQLSNSNCLSSSSSSLRPSAVPSLITNSHRLNHLIGSHSLSTSPTTIGEDNNASSLLSASSGLTMMSRSFPKNGCVPQLTRDACGTGRNARELFSHGLLKLKSNSSDLIELATIDDLIADRDVLSLFDPLRHKEEEVKDDRQEHKQLRTERLHTYNESQRTTGGSSSSDDSALSSSSRATDSNSRPSSNEKKVINIPEHITRELESASRKQVIKASKSLPPSPSCGARKIDGKVKNNEDRTTHHGKKISIEKRRVRTCDSAEHFLSKLKAIRGKYRYDDITTNSGVVISPVIETASYDSLSVKLVITTKSSDHPIIFTCNVKTSVEHIISHAVCTIFEDKEVDFDSFSLKVLGREEYLEPHSTLSDYSYVLECVKFDRDVGLVLVQDKAIERIFSRTKEDDQKFFEEVTTETILPDSLLQEYSSVNYATMKILIDTLDHEIEKVLTACRHGTTVISPSQHDHGYRTEDDDPISPRLRDRGAIQAVMAICSLLGGVETEALRASLKDFSERVKQLSSIKFIDSSHIERVDAAIDSLYSAVSGVLKLYSETFPVDFALSPLSTVSTPTSSSSQESLPSVLSVTGGKKKSRRIKISTDVSDEMIVFVGQLSQPPLSWSEGYRKFFALVELFHGDRKISAVRTQAQYLSPSSSLKTTSRNVVRFSSAIPRLQFDEWVTFPGISLSQLPRETCLYYSIHGIEYLDPDHISPIKREVSTLLSLSMVRIFDEEEKLIQGERLLSMWERDAWEKNKLSINSPNWRKDAPLLTTTLPEYEYDICFPPLSPDAVDLAETMPKDYRDIRYLSSQTQMSLYHVLNQDPTIDEMLTSDRELLWENRGNLISTPSALPKVLQSAKSWEYQSLHEIYFLINRWSELSVIDAMQLLLPTFPDKYVRKKAIQWITSLGKFDGLICDFLPQLIQAIRFEPYLDSPLIFYLLETSLKSVRVAHQLYWLLKENVNDPLLGFRSSLVLKSLLACCGSALRNTLEKEETFQSKLSSLSESVKAAKENSRLSLLHRSLEPVDDWLKEVSMVPLPLSPSILVSGIVIPNCSYFTSNTLPLKLSFRSMEWNGSPEHGRHSAVGNSTVETIFKIGDDLRQDTLTMQIIRIMDKLWLKEGLDLKIVTFDCVSTGDRKGFVEMVGQSETLRKIQSDGGGGIAGTLNERSILDWLKKYNTDELDFLRAKDNFLLSCAGYCVSTYVLGICDRHNDNIMITTSGHLFHIDFGKFLGDAQMVGSIKRDRVPFILSKEMVYAINGGSDSSKNFQFFVDLCCQAFNIIRRHTNLFLSLFSLMTASSIPGVTAESVKYVHAALLPELSEGEAMAAFTQKIDESSKAFSVQLNFLVHTLAQMRFTGDHNDLRLLSFVPKRVTKDTADGKITNVQAVFYFKKKDPEKQYFHVIRVDRVGQRDPFHVARTYDEFYEFYQKLCSIFPLAHFKMPSPGGMVTSTIRRTNTREVAEKRKRAINDFLSQLMSTSEEIYQSDLVYTFFQPLLRDMELQEVGVFSSGNHRTLPSATTHFRRSGGIDSPSSGAGKQSLPDGQVNLSIVYKNDSLIVMVRHAKHLQSRANPDRQPNTYVKTKLTPDPRNESKRKTKVILRNSNPSFMELIVYQLPLSFIKSKVLNVSVWEVDRIKGNIYVGAALVPLGEMDLTTETISWYPFTG